MATIVHESGIGEQLKALIRLQHVDSRIDQLEKMRGDLPEEIRDMEDEVTGLETRISNLKNTEKENEVAIRTSNLTIKESEGLIKKYEEQQLQVRNNREYDALTKEIEAQNVPIILVLNKEDQAIAHQQAKAKQAGIPMTPAVFLEAERVRLSQLYGCPVIYCSAIHQKHIQQLQETLYRTLKQKRPRANQRS